MSTAREHEADVLVVGAGPVGLTLALLLARWGVASTVVDAKDAREAIGSKAICVQRDVLDVFDRIGVARAMVDRGVTWTCGRTYYRDAELFTTTFPDTGRSAWPPFVNLGQETTEALLWAAVEREPLVTLRLGTRLIALRQDPDGVELVVEGAAGREELRAAYAVGCDGASSTTRKLLGLPFDGTSFRDLFLIADIRAELPFALERRFFFDPEWNPGRQVLVHPQPDSVWRIDWQVPDDFDLEADRASGGLDARIRRITGDRDYELVWLSAYRFHSRVAATFDVGRVFLAGDAAHLFAPFGARGMNSGILDADNLAWKLGLVLRGAAPAALLGTYTEERRAAALENLAVTTATMDFLVPQDDAAWERRREVLEAAVHDPGRRREVDSGKLAEPFWYLHSSLTTPAAEAALAAFPTAPGAARPPLPGVLVPDGPVRVDELPYVSRLRELVGTRFLVLVDGARASAAVAAALADTVVPALAVDLTSIDLEGVLRSSLSDGARVHVVRPDGHLAAVLDTADPRDVVRALLRATGQTAGAPASAARLATTGAVS